MSDPQQSIIDELNTEYDKLERNQTNPQVNFDTRIKPILKIIATIIEQNNSKKVEYLVSDLKDPFNSTYEQDWQQMLKKLSRDVSKLSKFNENYRDRTEVIHKNVLRAQWRTFRFRLLTTASVGLSLMILYSLAANCESLSMPLQMVR